MSKSANKLSNTSDQGRLMFEHTDRRGRVSLLPLSKETQRLFAVSILGSQPGTQPAGGRAATTEPGAAPHALTAREWQVFDLVVTGLSNKQIAYELSISPRTVELHRARLMQKMGVRNTASLIRAALFAA